jgi:hypothetical protein
MLLFFLCLASTTWSTSWQKSSLGPSSAPTLSGCTMAASSRPWSGPMNGPYTVLHHGPRSFTIRVWTRDEIASVSLLKPCMEVKPHQAVRDATTNRPALAQWQASHRPPRQPFRTHAGLVFRPPCPYTFKPGAAKRTPRNCFFPTPQGVFACPGLAAPSQPPQQRYPQHQQKLPARINL